MASIGTRPYRPTHRRECDQLDRIDGFCGPCDRIAEKANRRNGWTGPKHRADVAVEASA